MKKIIRYEHRLKFYDEYDDEEITVGKILVEEVWDIAIKWYQSSTLLSRKILKITMTNKEGDILHEEEDKDDKS